MLRSNPPGVRGSRSAEPFTFAFNTGAGPCGTAAAPEGRAYGHRVTITAVANLAVKVQDLDAAVAFYRRAGAEVTDPEDWRGARRADVELGPLRLTLFTRAVYEPDVEVADEGFLHVALFCDDLDRQLQGHDVVWGPAHVSGPTFGTRRIVFVDAPGRMRLEFMEQVEAPA